MERAQLKLLLAEIGIQGNKNGHYPDSGANIQFCCPFHGETRPSCGIHTDKEYGKCFACGESFNLAKLVAHQLGFYMPNGAYDLAKGYRWLEEKYNVEKKSVSKERMHLRKIDDEEDEEEESVVGRYETPLVRIAPFRGGKSTHQYFLNRGFTKETVKKFKVGWDRELFRVTVPIFWEDGTLFGVIGRAILNPKINGKDNPEYKKVYNKSNFARYFIYDSAPIGEILFPLNHFKPINHTAVLVEGQYDCMWIHQMGYPNALSSITSKLTVDGKTKECAQAELLKSLGVRKVILMRDDDEAGIKGNEHDYQILKKDFIVYGVQYPKGKTDPQSLTKEEYDYMIENKFPYKVGSKRRLRKIK